jgi:tetratricopeptide (TPR) repeat protein
MARPRSSSTRTLPSPTGDAGESYQAKGNYEQAIADYSKVIELDPNLALPRRASSASGYRFED